MPQLALSDLPAPARLRWFAPLFLAAIVIFAAMDALLASGDVTSDGVSYLDMADAIGHRDWAAVVNGYWNPGYPFVLYLGKALVHPRASAEYALVHWINFGILLLMMGCLLIFVRSLGTTRAERSLSLFSEASEGVIRISTRGLLLFGLISILASVNGAFAVHRFTPDNFLACCALLTAALLARIQRAQRWIWYPLLGAALAGGYLVKAVFFPVAVVVFLMLIFAGGVRLRSVLGSCLACLTFALLIFPQIRALSTQQGHFSYGESGRLNYLWLVDGVSRDVVPPEEASASARFKHPPQILSERPRIEQFSSHLVGTYPMWYDPSYWNAGVHVPFSLKTQILRAVINVFNFIEDAGNEPFLLCALVTLLVAGLLSSRQRNRIAMLKNWPVIVFALTVLGAYMLVEMDERYIAAALLILLLTMLASVRLRDTELAHTAVTIILLLGGFTCLLMQAGTHKAELITAIKGGKGAIAPNPYRVTAETLLSAGKLQPGDSIACVGSDTCYDSYWAHEDGLKIVSEVYLPYDHSHDLLAMDPIEQRRVFDSLAATGAKAVVLSMAANSVAPVGWIPLGDGTRYAKLLTPNR